MMLAGSLHAVDKTASGHLPAKGIGEHSARGRYVGQHVPTEAARHNAVLPGPASKARQITASRTGSTSPAQSAPFTRRHGLSSASSGSRPRPPGREGGLDTLTPGKLLGPHVNG